MGEQAPDGERALTRRTAADDGEGEDGSPSASGGDHSWTLTPADAGQRLDKALVERLGTIPGLSRRRLQELICDGQVSIDGAIAREPAAKLPARGVMEVVVPPPVAAAPRAQAIPLSVVFEDRDLLVLDKPAGLVVHPAAGHADGTLVNALIAHCGDSLSGIGGVCRPGIVHRLDKDTTGLMVVAKTDAAHQGLSALFADHGRQGSLDRRYKALVWGTPEAPHGTIDRPLGRHPRHREKVSVVAPRHGRHAVTHWRLEERFAGASLVECRLETGRTHQIRVHLTALGHPLIGDPVYGAGFRTKAARLGQAAGAAAAALGRQALHAATLGFVHPVTGASLAFDSPLPPDLALLAQALRAPQAEADPSPTGRPRTGSR